MYIWICSVWSFRETLLQHVFDILCTTATKMVFAFGSQCTKLSVYGCATENYTVSLDVKGWYFYNV
jgi:hypothetical protein